MRESQQIAAERRDLAAHHGKEDHPTGHESSRQTLEHSNTNYRQAQTEHQRCGYNRDAGAVAHPAENKAIAVLAYELWQNRGCTGGSPEDDWLCAVEQLRSGV